MSYETRKNEADRDQRYQALKTKGVNIVNGVNRWVTEATDLHTASPLQTEQDDVLALRTQLIDALKVELGL